MKTASIEEYICVYFYEPKHLQTPLLTHKMSLNDRFSTYMSYLGESSIYLEVNGECLVR